MPYVMNEGVRIVYAEYGDSRDITVLLLHGCGLDRTSLVEQAEYLSTSYRVIVPDLRGHGESDAPLTPYELPVFARDLQVLCEQVGVKRVIVVGHSMGGNIALTFAHIYADRVSAIVLIDSALFIPEAQKRALATQCEEAVSTGGTAALLKSALLSMCLPEDHRSRHVIMNLNVPEHVLASALPAHTVHYDPYAVTYRCAVPLAYIHSTMPFVDLDALRRVCPQVLTAATLGSGHLSPLEVPGQINAMLFRFLSAGPDKECLV